MFTTSLKPKEPVEIVLSEFAIITGTDQETTETQLIKLIKDWQEERLKTIFAIKKINKEAPIAHFNNVLREWIIIFIDEFGLNVLKRILAANISRAERDQRYSSKNREWALSYPDLHIDETDFLLLISPEIINEITTAILPEDNYDN